MSPNPNLISKSATCLIEKMGILLFVLTMALITGTDNASAAFPLNPQNPGLSDAERHAQLHQMIDFWTELDQTLDRTEFHPIALGEKLGTVDAAFEWVRDETRPIAYQGVLRGPRGVLQDRQGNSLDRALLLATMLEAQGHNVRLASGAITDPKTLMSLEEAANQPFDPALDQVESLLGAMATAGEQLSLTRLDDNEYERFIRAIEADQAFWEGVQESVFETLQTALGADVFARPHSSKPLNERWERHWWVQIESNAEWLSLDPALNDNQAGDQLANKENFFAINQLPSDLFHSLEFKVVATTREGDKFTDHTLVSTQVFPHEMNLPMVSIGLVPLSGNLLDMFAESAASENPAAAFIEQMQQVNEWLPVIQVGDYMEADKSILSDGRIRENPAEPPVGRVMSEAIGALGSLSLRGREQTATDREWSALHFDIVNHRPGEESNTTRNTRFDLADPNWREPMKSVYGISSDSLLKFGAIAQESKFFLDHFAMSPQWLAERLLEQLLPNEDLLIAVAMDPRFSPDANTLESLPVIPETILEFLTYRMADAHRRSHSVIDGIGLIALHETIQPLDQSTLRFSRTLDLIRHHTTWRGDQPPAIPLGLSDSVFEWAALEASGQVDSAAAAMHLESGASNWRLLRQASDWDTLTTAQGHLPPASFKNAWDKGHWVLARTSEGPTAYPVTGQWWDVNPETGDVLARDINGHGSASLSRVVPGVYFPLILASPIVEYYQMAGLANSVLFGLWGFGDCMFNSLNFACCMLQGAFWFGAGLLLGAGATHVAGAGVAFGTGVVFDALTSPISQTNPMPECTDLLEHERQRAGN